MDALEKYFIDGCKKCDKDIDVLNWYRNFYYKEPYNTERFIMADAINSIFMKLKNMGVNLNEM